MNRRTAILSALAAAFGAMLFKRPTVASQEPQTGQYNRLGASFLYNGKVFRTHKVLIERDFRSERMTITFEVDATGREM